MGSRPSSTAYWCYQCNRLIRLASSAAPLVCPLCNGSFVEEVEDGPRAQLLEAMSLEGEPERRISTTQLIEAVSNLINQLQEHRREEDGNFRPPLIVVRGGHRGREDNDGGMGFIMGTGSGIRGLPANIGDYFVGADFDRLIEQLTQNDRCGPPPAPASAVDAMPTVRVTRDHIRSNPNCPVCTEPFEIGTTVREMPCKHIFHSECIVPWLTQHNSCPICRQALPSEEPADNRHQQPANNGQQQPRTMTRGSPPVDAATSAIPITRQGIRLAFSRLCCRDGRGGRNGNSTNSSVGIGSLAGERASNSNIIPIRDNRAHHGSGHSQGRRSFFSYFNFNWLPFRSSNSNPQGTQTRASNSSDAVNWMRSGWLFDDGSDPFRWFN